MIEEKGWVVGLNGSFALIETERRSACESCAVRKGCGTGTLSKVLGKKSNRLKVLNPVGARVDDEVVIGLDEAALVKGSLAVYIVPLLGMFLAAGVAQWLFPSLGEGVMIGFALIGLIGGFFWVRSFSRRIAFDERYQPVILRVVSPTEFLLKHEP